MNRTRSITNKSLWGIFAIIIAAAIFFFIPQTAQAEEPTIEVFHDVTIKVTDKDTVSLTDSAVDSEGVATHVVRDGASKTVTFRLKDTAELTKFILLINDGVSTVGIDIVQDYAQQLNAEPPAGSASNTFNVILNDQAYPVTVTGETYQITLPNIRTNIQLDIEADFVLEFFPYHPNIEVIDGVMSYRVKKGGSGTFTWRMKEDTQFNCIYINSNGQSAEIAPGETKTVNGHSYSLVKNSDGTYSVTCPNATASVLVSAIAQDAESSEWVTYGRKGHTSITSNQVQFRGHTSIPFTSIAYKDASYADYRTMTFTLSENNADWHTLEGAGFLFNAKVENDNIYGYAVLFGAGSVNYYKVNGLPTNSVASNQFSSLPGVQLLRSVSKPSGRSWYLKLQISPFSMRFTTTDSTFSTDQYDIFGGLVPINDAPGYGYGPLGSFTSHNCDSISVVSFKDFTLKSAPNTPPTITAPPIVLNHGETTPEFVGVTAYDNEDGNITSQAKVILNTVNFDVPGTYGITYSVKDVFQAEDVCIQTVTILPDPEIRVRYVDELGNDLTGIMPPSIPVKYTDLFNRTVNIQVPDIYSYAFVEMYETTPDGITPSGSLNASNHTYTFGRPTAEDTMTSTTVTLVYQGLASVTVNYIDDEGNDVNSIFAALEPEEIKLLLQGNRGEEFYVYHADEIGDYTYDHMEISHNSQVPLPDDKIIPPDALERLSADFDDVSGDGTFKLYETAVITVVYNYRGTVYLKYQDEYGKDLTPRFTEEYPTFIEGYHNREADIPTPTIDFFEFTRYELVTRDGQRPSGYIDGPLDSTVTFGVRDASTITVHYRGWAIVNVRYVDDHGNDISALLGAEAVPTLRGYRYTETDIPTPGHRWYTFTRYDIETTPEAECPSGYIDNDQDSTVTFGLKDQTTITVVYHANAEIKLEYVDELGNKIEGLFEKRPPSVVRGLRDKSVKIPTPELDWYEWQYYIISTTEDAIPSGFIDDQYDTTATYGHMDASHISVVYKAHAEVPFEYRDTRGNDLEELGILPSDTIYVMRGDRGDTFEFKAPNLSRFELKTVRIIRTEEGEEPSAKNLTTKNGLYSAKYNIGDGATIQFIYDPLPHILRLTNPEGVGLTGGKIVITNADGEEVWSGVSNDNGEYLVPALGEGDYTVTELEAPEGYYLSTAPWKFTISKANEASGTITYINYPIIKTIVVIDANTLAPIEGSVIGVFDRWNNLLTQGTTDAEGKVSFWLQASGHYVIKQISVPGNYMLSGEIIVIDIDNMTIDNGQNTFTIRNVPPVQTGADPYSLSNILSFSGSFLGLGAAEYVSVRRKFKKR